MEKDPLEVLVRSFTSTEREVERLRRVNMRNNSNIRRKSRIPGHLAALWCEWNRKVPGAADNLAQAFGEYYRSECLKEWNRP